MKLLKVAFLAFIFSNFVFAQQINFKFDEVQKTVVIEKALERIKVLPVEENLFGLNQFVLSGLNNN